MGVLFSPVVLTYSYQVIHDKLSVSNASVELDVLMRKKPRYNWPMTIFIGGMCSAAICTVSFGGSFIDALVSFPLGALLVAIPASQCTQCSVLYLLSSSARFYSFLPVRC